METYLVEHYRPGTDAAHMRVAAAALGAAAAALGAEGVEIRYVRSLIVPGDEAFLSVFAADSEASVRETHRRAGVPLERISTAIVIETEEEEA